MVLAIFITELILFKRRAVFTEKKSQILILKYLDVFFTNSNK